MTAPFCLCNKRGGAARRAPTGTSAAAIDERRNAPRHQTREVIVAAETIKTMLPIPWQTGRPGRAAATCVCRAAASNQPHADVRHAAARANTFNSFAFPIVRRAVKHRRAIVETPASAPRLAGLASKSYSPEVRQSLRKTPGRRDRFFAAGVRGGRQQGEGRS
ncbi:MAG TPA: hypothetical protein DDZ68_04630 [Parvularcula sp.]|nr:hypothetical protein [Parvularcula sp.]HBS31711.1 hypothetical protein [Parvularcula sp.]